MLMIASTSFAQGRGPAAIRDTAGMFGEKEVAKAAARLERLEIRSSVPIVIETVESLRGQTIEEAAIKHARQSKGEGIYVLAVRRDRKIEVLISEAFSRRISETRRLAIRDAFVDGFKEGDFDAGLQRGVAMIEATLEGEKQPTTAVLAAPREDRSREDGRGSDPLVVRNQVRLTLPGARRIVAGATAKATAMGLKVNVAVVDDGGHMIAFERMDGARPASGYTATTKAITAATFRAPTGPVPAGTTAPDPLLNLSLQNAAMASGGKITTLLGGLPVVIDDQVIAGVGVGGGSGEQDVLVARAGIDAFLAEVPSVPDRDPARARTDPK